MPKCVKCGKWKSIEEGITTYGKDKRFICNKCRNPPIEED